MPDLLLGLSLFVSIAWAPIMGEFFASWQARRNPVSLAIVCLIVFTAFICPGLCWGFMGANQQAMVALGCVLSAAVCANFYIAFHHSNRRFNGHNR